MFVGKGQLLRTAAALGLGAAVLAWPQAAAQGFAQGVTLCMRQVLPALFPFFVVCEWLTPPPLPRPLGRALSRALGLRQDLLPDLLLSWLGGYAVCAQLVCRALRDHRADARQAQLLLLLGCCSGPGFVAGSVGGLMLGNPALGVLLYGLQLAANLFCCALLLPRLPAAAPVTAALPPAAPRGAPLPLAIRRAVESCLGVCGCVVFFRLVCSLAAPLLPAAPLWQAVAAALCEVSAGCASFAQLGGAAGLYGCCLALGGLGASVWAQLALLLEHRLPLRFLAMARALQLVVYPGLVALLARTLPGSTAVYSSLAPRTIVLCRLPVDAALAGGAFVVCALYKLRQIHYNKKEYA